MARVSSLRARAASSGSAPRTWTSSSATWTGTAIDGLTLTPDGTTLFALTRIGGRIARLDVATGEVERWVGEAGFDRLLGALPCKRCANAPLSAFSGIVENLRSTAQTSAALRRPFP